MSAPPTVLRFDAAQAPRELRPLVETLSKQAGQVGLGLSRSLTFKENVLCDIIGPLSVRGAPMWALPTYSNSWVDFSGSIVGKYRKTATGMVVSKGALKSGTLNTAAFNVPALFRPDQDVNLPAEANGAYGKLKIQPNGDVIPVSGSNTIFSIDATWPAADGLPGATLSADIVFKLSVVTKRPLMVLAATAQLKSDQGSVVGTAQPSWTYDQGQVRVSSIPGLAPDTDYLATFLVVGG